MLGNKNIEMLPCCKNGKYSSGVIFTAAGSSIDVVDPNDGVLLGKMVISNETMNTLVAILGGEWWFAGQGGILEIAHCDTVHGQLRLS